MSEIAIVGCSKTKAGHRCRAAEMYTGQYFKACLHAAGVIAPDRVFILSAKYGLIRPAKVIDPYDLRLGQPGAVDVRQVTWQAWQAGVGLSSVVALCGADYAGLIKQVWEDVDTPLAHLGIGQQLHVLGELRAGHA